MGGYKVNTDIFSVKNFTVFCNYLRLNYNDLENFLLLVDQERKKFSVRPIERKEYLDALNYYIGRAQVETSRIRLWILQGEIDRFPGQARCRRCRGIGPELFQEVSFERVVQVMDEQMGYQAQGRQPRKGDHRPDRQRQSDFE